MEPPEWEGGQAARGERGHRRTEDRHSLPSTFPKAVERQIGGGHGGHVVRTTGSGGDRVAYLRQPRGVGYGEDLLCGDASRLHG